MTELSALSRGDLPSIDLQNFTVDLSKLRFQFWWILGQTRSKCEHIGRAPLAPEKWMELHTIYLVKGVHSTTAIEGNTLTEDEVLRIYRDELTLPKSRQYLELEVKNVIRAFNEALGQGLSQKLLTIDEVNGYNEKVLRDLEVEAHVYPGKMRDRPVTVGRYLCPPAADVLRYMERFVRWYNEFPPEIDGLDVMSTAIIKAIAAHLYFVLIHPYGDGNGRTARLIEWRTLDAAGIATPATHLLSNHYNLTRSKYYQVLDQASLGRDATAFYEYALQGLVDQLDEQLKHFHQQYARLVYSELVRSSTLGTSQELVKRRQELAVAICRTSEPTRRGDIRGLTSQLAEKYAGATEKTISRDLSALKKANLILETDDGISAITSAMYWRHRRSTESLEV